MKNSKAIVLTFLFILLVGVLCVFYVSKSNKNRLYNWTPWLSVYGDQPYDLSVFKNTLAKKYDKLIIADKATFNKMENLQGITDYYALGLNLYYTAKEVDALVKFTKSGNNVFISAKYINDTVLLKFGLPKEMLALGNVYQQDAIFSFNGFGLLKNLKLSHYISSKEKGAYKWVFFKENNSKTVKEIETSSEDSPNTENGNETDYAETAEHDVYLEQNDAETYLDGEYWYGNNYLYNTEPIAEMEDLMSLDKPKQVVFRRFKVGEGNLFILTTPIVLANFYCANDSTNALPIGVLSYLNAKNAIIDLEARQIKVDGMNPKKSNSPLRYILSKKWFKVGFYGLLILGFAFVLLRSYRKIRPTELYALPENRSVEQIRDIAAVLFYDKDINTVGKYLQNAYEFWYSENQYKLKNADYEMQNCINKCNEYLQQDSLLDEQIKDFQIKFYQLKKTYGK